MSAINLAWLATIDEINRVQLRPEEMIVFRTRESLTDKQLHAFLESIDKSPLKGRCLLLQGEWLIDVVEPL